MKCAAHIFRAYDIRGKAFVDFDEDGFFLIAQAYGHYIKEKFSLPQPKVFVSGDGRNSMPELFPAVLSGLESAGCEVVWGGSIPTPINFFVLKEKRFDASIQITASHNPPQDNGLKLTDRNGSVCGEEIQKIYRRLQKKNVSDATTGTCINQCQKIDYAPEYRAKLKSITAKQNPVHIIIDAGNAIPGMFYPLFFRDQGHSITEVLCDLNPNFPIHQPDPEEAENLKLCQKTVLEKKADFGFCFDGDGDRIGIVLANGAIINADKIMFVLTADFLSRNPGETVIIDAMTSSTLIEKIKELDGNPIVTPTGHSFIEEAMHQNHSRMGGEQSGHFMFGENFYGHDDACLAGLRFISAVEQKPELLEEITKKWPKMVEYSEKIIIPESEKFDIIQRFKALIENTTLPENPQIILVDGVRINWTKNEWAIIRGSNTSPKISVRIEALNQKNLLEKQTLILDFLERAK